MSQSLPWTMFETYKCDVLNPLNREIDDDAGPGSKPSGLTVCNDPETTLLSWVIYGELFHHSLELAYLPFPRYKPLGSIIRYKWFVYCMPDVNSFTYMGFPRDGSETPQFFKDYVQSEDDRFQQLSMHHAIPNFFYSSMWTVEVLEDTPTFQAMNPALRGAFTSSVMHMGLKSLEILVPGGPKKLEGDLDRVADGIRGVLDITATDKHLRRLVGDPWLWTAFPTLESDLYFTLWGAWVGEGDKGPLMEAIRRAFQKKLQS
ncbi:hypothetical protein DFH06DRAFT_589932 [Mycena polygramma]|nr:hypothetical protein DFH06DRAFT_589932 [Mycena polygramma]